MTEPPTSPTSPTSPASPASPTRATGRIRWIEPAGLDRFDGVDLVEDLLGRPLTGDEESWASALTDHADGAPRVLVQAVAVLKGHEGGELPSAGDPQEVVAHLVEACDDRMRQVLRILESLRPRGEEGAHAAVLGAEHLAVLTAGSGTDQAGAAELFDAVAGSLVAAGLVEAETDVYGVTRHRLADGVVIGESAAAWIPAVGQELAAWATRVGPLEAAGEAEAAIAALRGAAQQERLPVVRALARALAPALAATLRWDQWGVVLELGRDAAVRSGAQGDAGYFHHELAIRALCLGEGETAAVELAAAVKAYLEAGDDRRGGAARRAATVAGIALPDALLAIPEGKVVGKRYKGALVGGPGGPAKKVTVGTASAMVLFVAAAMGVAFGKFGGGGTPVAGGGGGAGSNQSTDLNPDNAGADVIPPWYSPLAVPGAQPPVVTVSHTPPPTPGGAQQQPNQPGSTQQQPPTTTSYNFLRPTGPGASTPSSSSPVIGLPSYSSYNPPQQTTGTTAQPSSPSSSITFSPPPPPPTTSTQPPPTTPSTTPSPSQSSTTSTPPPTQATSPTGGGTTSTGL